MENDTVVDDRADGLVFDLGSEQLFWDIVPGLDLTECLVYRYIVI